MSYRTPPVIIERTGLYRITSFGNGDAYPFERLGDNPAEVFIQGDAATDFRAEYDAAGIAYEARQDVPWDDCLAELWSLVSEA